MKVYESGQARQLGTVAIGLALMWLSVFALTQGWSAWRRHVSAHNLAAARSDMQRLRVPNSYKPFAEGCRWYRCYLISAPSYKVAPTAHSVLASTGATPVDLGRLLERTTGVTLPGASTISGCNTIDTPRQQVLTNCALTGYLHTEAVDVFVHPYFAPGAAARHSILHITEVDIAFDGPAPGDVA